MLTRKSPPPSQPRALYSSLLGPVMASSGLLFLRPMPPPCLGYGDFPEAGHSEACFSPGPVTHHLSYLAGSQLPLPHFWKRAGHRGGTHPYSLPLGLQRALQLHCPLPTSSTSHPEAKEGLRNWSLLCPTQPHSVCFRLQSQLVRCSGLALPPTSVPSACPL